MAEPASARTARLHAGPDAGWASARAQAAGTREPQSTGAEQAGMFGKAHREKGRSGNKEAPQEPRASDGVTPVGVRGVAEGCDDAVLGSGDGENL